MILGLLNQLILGSQNEQDYHPDKVKEKWISNQLEMHESEFTEQFSLRVFVGTWNVNGKLSNESLEPWLLHENNDTVVSPIEEDDLYPQYKRMNETDYPSGFAKEKEWNVPPLHPLIQQPDLYVIGFQEVDLSAEAFLLNDSTRDEFWTLQIDKVINESGKYTKLISTQLVGMLLVIFIKSDLEKHVKNCFVDSAGCGIMGNFNFILGMMGNKGGVAVRIEICDSILCFVNSHLAADSKDVERRNQDYSEICKRISFQLDDASASIWNSE